MATHQRAQQTAIAIQNSRIQRIASAGLLLLALGFAPVQSGCGSRQNESVFDFGGVEALRSEVRLPASREDLLRASTQDVYEAKDAYVLALLKELSGDPNEALRLYTGDYAWSESPSLSVARAINLYGLRDQAPDFDRVAVEWLESDGLIGAHPYETWLRHELAHMLAARAAITQDRRERVTGETWGHPALWNTYGPASVLDAVAFEEESPALGVRSLSELPTNSLQRFVKIAPNVSRVEAPEGAKGTMLFESFLTVEEAGDALLVVQASESYRIWVNGVEVDRRAPSETTLSAQHARRVGLSKGGHRIVVQAGSRSVPNFSFRLVPLSASFGTFDAEPIAEVASKPIVGPLEPSTAARWFVREGRSLTAIDWLSAMPIAEFTMDSGAVSSLLNQVPGENHPLYRWLEARLWNAHLGLTSGARQNQALASLRAIDDAWRPLSGVDELVVRRLVNASQEGVAEAWLREKDSASVASPRLRLLHAEVLRRLGFNASSEVILEELQERYPTWCPAVEALMRAWTSRGFPTLPGTPEGSEGQCSEQRSEVAWAHYAPLGQWERVLEHTSGLVQRGPSRMEGWRRHLRALIGAKRWADVESTLVQAQEWGMPEAEVRRWQAEALEGQGNTVEARRAIRARTELQPWEIDWQHQSASIDRQATLEDLRIDGLSVAKEWFAKRDASRSEVVYVLDYGAWRYFENGGGIAVVHQMMQLNSRDALEQWGEIAIPRGNALLNLRAISPDGTIRVPERIAGKDSISIPALGLGDIVEIEYLRSIPPVRLDEDFHDSSLFFFATDVGEMARSEVVFEYPESWAKDVAVEVRNFAGTHNVERRNGRVVETIRQDNTPQMLAEPGMPSFEALAPTARLVVGASVEKMIRAYRNRIIPSLTMTPDVQAFTNELISGARSAREKAFRIFRFVNDEIVDQNGFFSVPAQTTLTSGQGDRYALMVAMLQAAGFAPQVVLIQSFGDDYGAGTLPSMSRYGTAALRVKVGRESIWLMAAGKSTPFDWLLPETQGQEAIVIYGDGVGDRITTPVDEKREASRLNVHIKLREDGSAMVDVVETMSMEASAYHREDLEMMPNQDDRLRYLEYELSASFLGAELKELAYTNPEDADAPLVRTYSFELPELALEGDVGKYFDRGLFVPRHVYYYAGLERRRLPLVTTYTHNEVLEVTLEAPEGMRISTSLTPVDAAYRGIRYHREASISENGRRMHWKRTMRVPMFIVEPADYPEYARFMRDLATGERIRVVLQNIE